MNKQGPIVGTELYRKVMDAAEWDCECRGACGREHNRLKARAWKGRCMAHWGSGHNRRLICIPRESGIPWAQASTLAAYRLMAVCPGCYREIEKIRSESSAPADTQEGLF